MTTRLSTGLRNFLAQGGSYADAFTGGRIEIYTGAQPATADTAASGTLLCTITTASGAHTPETQALGSITLTGGGAGSVNTLTVNSVSIIGAAVPFNTSLNQTATDLAAAINSASTFPEYSASASGAVVTIAAGRGAGALVNGFVVAATTTTITTTLANMAGGVTAVNGLTFGSAAAGVIAKSALTWSGVNGATGTAGWFRHYGAVTDTGGADATESTIREDGAIATSGSQLNLTSTALTSDATTTLSAWSRTFPAA